jgi:Putative zinc-finger
MNDKRDLAAGCPQIERIHDYLDGLLAEPAAAAFRDHLDSCAACEREYLAFVQVFAELDRTPLIDPGPELARRILAAVVPGRRHWVRAFGWTYAGSLAASAAAIAVVLALPGTQAAWERFSAGASWFMVQAVSAAFSVLGSMTLGIANGWGDLLGMSQSLAAVPRALAVVLAEPTVLGATSAALFISTLLLAWIHRRERGPSRRVDPLGLLGV